MSQYNEPTPAEVNAQKAANRLLLGPLTDIGLGGTDPLTVSLETLVARVRATAVDLVALDAAYPAYAAQVAQVVEGLDRKLRTLVAQNAAAPIEPQP